MRSAWIRLAMSLSRPLAAMSSLRCVDTSAITPPCSAAACPSAASNPTSKSPPASAIRRPCGGGSPPARAGGSGTSTSICPSLHSASATARGPSASRAAGRPAIRRPARAPTLFRSRAAVGTTGRAIRIISLTSPRPCRSAPPLPPDPRARAEPSVRTSHRSTLSCAASMPSGSDSRGPAPPRLAGTHTTAEPSGQRRLRPAFMRAAAHAEAASRSSPNDSSTALSTSESSGSGQSSSRTDRRGPPSASE